MIRGQAQLKPIILHDMDRYEGVIGLINFGNKTTPSTQFEAQVPKSDWDKVQASLQSRDRQRETRGKVKAYKSPIATLGKCHFCGCQIVTEQAKKGKYIYLRCSNGKKFSDADFYQKKFK